MNRILPVLACLLLTLPATVEANFNLSCWQAPREFTEKMDRYAGESFPNDRMMQIVEAGRGAIIDGVAAQKLEPMDRHDKGVSNKGLYRINRNGIARIIKIIDSSYREIDDEWRGYRRGASLGAPEIVSAGMVQINGSKQSFPYVEILEKYPGEHTSTFKGIQTSNNYDFLTKGKPPLSKQLAFLFARAWEEHYLVRDIDFIFTENRVSLLDTAFWDFATEINEDFVHSFNHLANLLHYAFPRVEIKRQLHLDLVEAVAARTGLTPEEKVSILSHIKFERGEFTEDEWIALLQPLIEP